MGLSELEMNNMNLKFWLKPVYTIISYPSAKAKGNERSPDFEN